MPVREDLTIGDIKALHVFRKTRQKLASTEYNNIDDLQYCLASKERHIGVDDLKALVNLWIYETPLRFIPGCKFPFVNDFIGDLQKKGVRIGFFSDYPGHQKLDALGIKGDAVVCSTEKVVDRFKPHPQGLLVASQRLEVDITDCILIGDRNEKDGQCAKRAGIPFINIKTFGHSPYSNDDLYRHMDSLIAK